MTYCRAFHLGDRIKVGELLGDVTKVGLMVTNLRSVKNEELILPNSMILNGHVINYSSLAREQGLILHTTVGIGYETPWRQVEAMLLMAAERTPGLLLKPPPYILHKELGDFCVTYELSVYTATHSAMFQLYTQLHRNILDVFNEYGVQNHDTRLRQRYPRAEGRAKGPVVRQARAKLYDAQDWQRIGLAALGLKVCSGCWANPDKMHRPEGQRRLLHRIQSTGHIGVRSSMRTNSVVTNRV